MVHYHYLFNVPLRLTLSVIYMILFAHKFVLRNLCEAVVAYTNKLLDDKCVMGTSKYVVMKYNLPESSIISDKKIVYSEYN